MEAMKGMKRAVLEDRGYTDWQLDMYGDLICPHGHSVEDDGTCHEGCVSPLRQEGMI